MREPYKEQRLKHIRMWALTARQYFDGHAMKADELPERSELQRIEFLLSVIDDLEERAK